MNEKELKRVRVSEMKVDIVTKVSRGCHESVTSLSHKQIENEFSWLQISVSFVYLHEFSSFKLKLAIRL